MEKCNSIEAGRTPCRKANSTYCDCADCKTKNIKQAEDKQASIHDIESLAKVHK